MRELKCFCPAESPEKLVNPERGFYAIFKAELTDEPQDAGRLVSWIYTPDGDELLLCEFSLAQYRDRPLSKAALGLLCELLEALRKRGGGLILRFLYDWDGRGAASEPGSLELVLEHIRQLGDAVRANADLIFVHQGLLTGSWGEMHDTRYGSDDDIKRLFAQMRLAFGPDVTIAVRTAEQLGLLRQLPECGSLGLYNDGIMGSVSDLGSYGGVRSDEERLRALEGISGLCSQLPGGGEAVYNPLYSGYRNAVKTLALMKVSYLNRFHDLRALGAWAGSDCGEGGVWEGMDGLNYIERHLGYRFVIRRVRVSRRLLSGRLLVEATLSGDGFAPAYFETEAQIILKNNDTQKPFAMSWKGSGISSCCGSKRAEAYAYIDLRGLGPGSWQIYLRLWSRKHQRQILPANEGGGPAGHLIGGFENR